MTPGSSLGCGKTLYPLLQRTTSPYSLILLQSSDTKFLFLPAWKMEEAQGCLIHYACFCPLAGGHKTLQSSSRQLHNNSRNPVREDNEGLSLKSLSRSGHVFTTYDLPREVHCQSILPFSWDADVSSSSIITNTSIAILNGACNRKLYSNPDLYLTCLRAQTRRRVERAVV